MIDPTDPVALTRALIRCPSVTPDDHGALDLVEEVLGRLGFTCHRMVFEEPGTAPVGNLYARLGTGAPHLAFAGHTDVVPPGESAAWRVDPFAAEVIDDAIYGRGAVDMKGAIGCFIAATARFLANRRPAGSIGFLITGDEEGPAINGTRKLVAWLKGRRETVDACLVGEPTNPQHLGETIKIGRRGSLTGWLTVPGVQGHVAYPERADNPIPRLLTMLSALTAEPLDGGTETFEPSQLVISTVDVDNPTPNVTPAEARATFNIRFNNHHTASSLTAWIERKLASVGGAYRLEVRSDAAAFVTPAGPFTELVESVIERELDITPELSTSGGTSDARFIKDLCPVVEFGLVGATMHQVDERVPLEDLATLTAIYRVFLDRFFGTPG